MSLVGRAGVSLHTPKASRFQVPFAFEAAGKSFPAGVYTVDPVTDGVFLIRSAASGDSAAVMASPSAYAATPKPGLVFDKSPDLAVLSSVNLNSGLTLTVAPAKRVTATLTLPSKGSVVLSHP